MTLERLIKSLKKDTNGSLSCVLRAEQVYFGLITYSEALQLISGKPLSNVAALVKAKFSTQKAGV